MQTRNSYLIHKVFKSYLIASILATVATTLGLVVDGIIVSHLMGPLGLSAVNLASPLSQFYVTFHLLVNTGIAMLTATAIGKGDIRQAERYFSFAITCDLALGLVFSLTGIFFLDEVTAALCTNAELYPLVRDYVQVMLLTAPVYLLLPGLGVFVRTDGSPRLTSTALIVANIVNLGLDIILIKYCGLGIAGSSIATAIGFLTGILIELTHFRKERRMLRYVFTFKGISISEAIVMGLPMAFGSVFMTVRLLCINHIVLSYLGTIAVSILAICFNLLRLVNMFISGTVQTLQPVGSLLIGLEDYQGVRIAVNKALRVLLQFLSVGCLIIMIIPGSIAGMFGLDAPSTIGEAEKAIRIVSISFIFFGITYLLMIVYQLTKRHKLAIFISTIQSLAIIPFMYVFARVAPGLIWGSFLAGEVAVLLTIVAITGFIRKRDKSVAPLTLLPDSRQDRLLDLSISRDKKDFKELLSSVETFLEQNGVDSSAGNRVKLCIEELVRNVIRHGYSDSKKHYIDIRIHLREKQTNICITDDGIPFNPIRYDKQEGLGLLIVKGICQDLEYKYLFNQNRVFAKIPYQN